MALYRQLNFENGYQYRNDNERGYLSHDKYPVQNTDYIGKYICIRYKSEYHEEINQRFHIPSGYYDSYIYPENSGLRNIFFRILRWDTEEPFRAILINTLGEVIVAYTTELEEHLYDLTDSMILTATQSRAENKGYEYLILNETDDADLFFDRLYYEKVKLYGKQREELIGLQVWTEYEKDFALPRSADVLKYKNNHQYKLSDETKEEMIRRNPVLFAYSFTDEIFDSFPYHYNPHEKGKIDDSRRAINRAIVIRADYSDCIEPEYVVMELLETGKVRFVTQHEANLYYLVENIEENHTIEQPFDFTPVYNIVSNYFYRIDTGGEPEEDSDEGDNT